MRTTPLMLGLLLGLFVMGCCCPASVARCTDVAVESHDQPVAGPDLRLSEPYLGEVDAPRFVNVTKTALKSGADFHELTQYPGRRNADLDDDDSSEDDDSSD